MTTHILEVAERMADRIGVIAGGRLIAEGTLDELRRQAGKAPASLEDTFLTLVAEQAAAVSRPARSPGSRATNSGSPGATGSCMMTAGGAAPRAQCRHRADRLRRLPACGRLVHGRRACRRHGDRRHRDADRLTGTCAAVLVADAVAGDGVGDARLLRPRRSRSDPVLARFGAPCSRCASARIALSITAMAMLLAAPFINVLAFLGGCALARRLWRRRGHGRGGDGRWPWR